MFFPKKFQFQLYSSGISLKRKILLGDGPRTHSYMCCSLDDVFHVGVKEFDKRVQCDGQSHSCPLGFGVVLLEMIL